MESEPDLQLIAESICTDRGLVLEERSGGGGFKEVFRVHGPDDGPVALKVIKASGCSPRTIREVEALERCDHPNIARLFVADAHTFEGEDYDFTLEEFLPGGTLTSMLEQRGALDTDAAIRLGEQLLDAVAHLAELGLVHRDIKPDNIMFRADGETPVLVDFGIVRDLSASSLTLTWAQCGPGTPYFAAPEQLNNEKPLISWRTDEFSLGVVLCHSRFGVHPYQHPSDPPFSLPTVERVAARGPRGPGLLDQFREAGLPCLDRMTRAWPVERYRRAAELLDAWAQQGEG